MEKLRIALIGVGGMGSHHLYSSHARNPRVEIVALCDIIEERCVAAAKKLGRDDIAIYTDYKALIDNEELDAVDIATPNRFHPLSRYTPLSTVFTSSAKSPTLSTLKRLSR